MVRRGNFRYNTTHGAVRAGHRTAPGRGDPVTLGRPAAHPLPGAAGARGRRAGADSQHAACRPRSAARARALRGANSPRCRLRRVPSGSEAQFRRGEQSRGGSGRRHHPRGRSSDSLHRARYELARRHDIGGYRRTPGCLRGRGGVAAPASPSPHGGDPRGGKPLQRRERPAGLPDRRHGGHDGCRRRLERRAALSADLWGRRGRRDRPGPPLPVGDPAGAGHSHIGDAAVHRHLRRVGAREPHRSVIHHHHDRLCDDPGAQGAGARRRAPPDLLLRGLGRGGVRIECPGVRADRAAAARHSHARARRRVARLPLVCGRGLRHRDPGALPVGDLAQPDRALEAAPQPRGRAAPASNTPAP
jgi:hypothetical protein